VELALPVVRSGSSALGRYFKTVATSTSSETEIGVARSHLFQINKNSEKTTIDSNIECIVIAHAIPGELRTEALPSWLLDSNRLAEIDPNHLFVRYVGGKPNIDTLKDLEFQDIPLSYFEFAVENDDTQSAMNIVPKAVYFREPVAKLKKTDPKNIEITFTISQPTSTGYIGVLQSSSALLAQIPATFTALHPSLSFIEEDQQNFRTVWVSPLPKRPGADIEAPVIEQMERTGKGVLLINPVNVVVSYRETDEPVLWLEFVSDMLSELGSEKK
jgi:hypothetical protein